MLAHDGQAITGHRFRRNPIGFADGDEAINCGLDGCLIDDIHIEHDLQTDAVNVPAVEFEGFVNRGGALRAISDSSFRHCS